MKIIKGGSTNPTNIVKISKTKFKFQSFKDEQSNIVFSLDVKDIKSRAPLLGEDVTVRQVKNAVHDIFVSPGEAREDAYRYLNKWLKHKEL